MLFTNFKRNIFTKLRLRIWSLTWALQDLNITWRKKVENIFDPEVERNCVVWLLCFFLILIDIQNENLSFDKCIHRTVSSSTQCGKHCCRVLIWYTVIHFWILNQSVGNALDIVFVEKYIVQIISHNTHRLCIPGI